jgi:hypothetical protein
LHPGFRCDKISEGHIAEAERSFFFKEDFMVDLLEDHSWFFACQLNPRKSLMLRPKAKFILEIEETSANMLVIATASAK